MYRYQNLGRYRSSILGRYPDTDGDTFHKKNHEFIIFIINTKVTRVRSDGNVTPCSNAS